jgi:dTDP-4-dehydrorhamnose 3,5-epimerase
MKFKKTKLKRLYVINPEFKKDARGFFARSFCEKEFGERNLKFRVRQSNISYNKKRGTLRGMHYQIAPHKERKLVSCIRGAIYDVVIDLRPGSRTYCKWLAIKLVDRDYASVYIPEGFAHGFQSLTDDTVVLYQMSEFYHPESARGLRWDDPEFKISWPISPCILSKKDSGYPDFKG